MSTSSPITIAQVVVGVELVYREEAELAVFAALVHVNGLVVPPRDAFTSEGESGSE